MILTDVYSNVNDSGSVYQAKEVNTKRKSLISSEGKLPLTTLATSFCFPYFVPLKMKVSNAERGEGREFTDRTSSTSDSPIPLVITFSLKTQFASKQQEPSAIQRQVM